MAVEFSGLSGKTLVTVKHERYLLLEEIGRGGFAIVYKARNEVTGLITAVKVLKNKKFIRADQRNKYVARFYREMQICASIAHPHVVQLLDKGLTGHDGPFAVFEFIDGQNLRQILQKKRALAVPYSVGIMAQALSALRYLHAIKVMHGDLKPQNIMVTQMDSSPFVKVLDFGTSTFVSDMEEDDFQTKKSAGAQQVPWGSPAYSAPEQLLGQAPTAKSDLYSWALIFIECLTGAPVMQGRSIKKLFQQQLQVAEIELPKFLSGHPLGAFLKTILKKDPAQRPGDAKMIAQQLAQIDFSNLNKVAKPTHESFPDNTGGETLDTFAAKNIFPTMR